MKHRENSQTKLTRLLKLPSESDLQVDDIQSDFSDLTIDFEETTQVLKHVKRFSFWWLLTRWPLLFIIGLSITIDLVLYVLVRQTVVFYEHFIFWVGERAVFRKALFKASTYDEWSLAAKTLDDSFNNDKWIANSTSPYYNEPLIIKLVHKLQKRRLHLSLMSQHESAYTLTQSYLRILLHCIQKNFGGIESEALYSHTYHYSKKIVKDYVDQVLCSLEFISESTVLDQTEKREIFERADQVYGRSALCMSGGGSFGYYHLGVAKALMDTNTMPQVITGTSAGSFIAAILCVRTDEEIYRDVFQVQFYKELTTCQLPWKERWKNWKKTGAMFNSDVSYGTICSLLRGTCVNAEFIIGTMTFMEAFKRTGKILNISVVPDELYATSAKQLNYITTPDVIVASAVMASSAIPGILESQTLLQKDSKGRITPFRNSGKKWRDGSLNSDIPERDLHLLFGVNYTIVSQVNPHIILFFYEREGSAGAPTAHRYGQGWHVYIINSDGRRGGFLGSALTQHFKLDLLRWMLLLKDLDLLPKIGGSNVSDVFLQKFHGSVTVVPHGMFEDYYNIIADPDEHRMRKFLSEGQRRTWPKISMIRNRVAIENKLAALILKHNRAE